ncbi:50S ribosomal protein L31e [Candidatus Pacearchaeota archaeon]|nr:50S ribosomal protein L31e [Candidatus Pacearchaeota archaeon]
MASKTQTPKVELEREYVIPLRNEWRKVANYRRTGRAVKEIKKFIARHMKVPDHDINKVKLDIYLNQEVWFRGRKKPPAKIKVRARKEGEIVKVELAEMPEHWKFEKTKHEKRHKSVEKPKEKPLEEKPQEEETGEKKEEKEKAQSSAEAKSLQAEKQAKEQKHTTKAKEPGYHRLALKK